MNRAGEEDGRGVSIQPNLFDSWVDPYSNLSSKGKMDRRGDTKSNSVLSLCSVYSVSAFTERVRGLLESRIGSVKVEGEVSNFVKQSSGHCYFTLKDASSQLSVVMFKSATRKQNFSLENGMQIVASGRVSVYSPRGSYQLVANRIDLCGEGLLQARFDRLKKKLYEEGLFDTSRKLSFPDCPRCLLLLTSPNGAAVRDFINILTRRAPYVHVYVLPIPVQGERAFEEIVKVMKSACSLIPKLPRKPELMVITRGGGGSIEDLWNFNEELLARAIVDFPLPVLSAIGHEIDFTICDFVADRRASTPSEAAEMVAKDVELLRGQVRGCMEFIYQRVSKDRKIAEERLAHLYSMIVAKPRHIFEVISQRFDISFHRLGYVVTLALERAYHQFERFRYLPSSLYLQSRVDIMMKRVDYLGGVYVPILRSRVLKKKMWLESKQDLLRALSPIGTLSRGYSMTVTESGHVVDSAKKMRQGEVIVTLLKDSSLRSVVRDISNNVINPAQK